MTMQEHEGPRSAEPQEHARSLILTRKVNQGLLANNGVDVTILSVERDRVKLGFKCPPEMQVLRSELDLTGVKRKPSDRPRGLGLLILVRKQGQAVNLGDDMVVKVLGVERDRVKIGIRAPKEVAVLRSELVSPDERAAFLSSGRGHQ